MLHHPLDALDHGFVGAITVLIQHPHPSQVCSWCHTVGLIICPILNIGDDPCNVGAVAVWIRIVSLMLNKINPCHNLVVKARVIGDAGVQHSHRHALPCHALIPGHICAHQVWIICCRGRTAAAPAGHLNLSIEGQGGNTRLPAQRRRTGL